ncbi:hypothetical protein EV401DRAFT_1882007 [Pisolithus croceorrhizus]|nr:hypothetical protein EV401DRAFT_1882007 [Pisolithus croceorrhizus]
MTPSTCPHPPPLSHHLETPTPLETLVTSDQPFLSMSFLHGHTACLRNIKIYYQSHPTWLIQTQSPPTSFNAFWIACEYQHQPSYDPEHSISVHELSKSTGNGSAVVGSDIQCKPPPWPWQNMSIWRLMAWQLMGGGKKSSTETTRLVHNMLLAKDFNLEDISGFNAETAIRSMDRSEATLASDSNSISEQDGWKTDVNVDIQVPSLLTMHAQFGHATAWPVYLFFGNLSKYEHASASPGTCHPVAFIPSFHEEEEPFGLTGAL